MTDNCTVLNLPKNYGLNPQIGHVSVEQAAASFGISTRRVRKMLSTGVLEGVKISRVWHVTHPYRVVIGTRGPVSQAFKSRSLTPKKRGNSPLFKNAKYKKGE